MSELNNSLIAFKSDLGKHIELEVANSCFAAGWGKF